MRSTPTRADVAALAGVSSAVVSYVMNNGPRPVSESARNKVNAAVLKLGYRPNQVARALRSNKSSSIGLLMPDAGNPFFWELVQQIEHECYARGLVLFVGTTSNDSAREHSYLTEFTERQVDGLILISASSDLPDPRHEFSQLPVVLVDRAPSRDPGFVVQSDNFQGAYLAVRHLLDSHARRRILLLAGPKELGSTNERWAGAVAALREGENSSATFETNYGDFSLRSGFDGCATAALGDEFDAIFAFSDVQGIGALRACETQGVRVPDDVSVIAFDGTDLGQFVTPSLTSVVQDSAHMAANALEELERQIASRGGADSDNRPVGPITLDTLQLRIGESCGCVNSR